MRNPFLAAVSSALLLCPPAGAQSWFTIPSEPLAVPAPIGRAVAVEAASGGLSPIMNTPVDWRRAKGETERAFDRILAHFSPPESELDRGIHKIIGQIRKLVADVHAKDRAEADRKLAFFRAHPIPGVAPAALEARVEFVHRVHLAYAYGYLMPEPFNESVEDIARDVYIPGFRLEVFMTHKEYCSKFERYGNEINGLIKSIDPDFFPKPVPGDDKPICEQEGLSGDR